MSSIIKKCLVMATCLIGLTVSTASNLQIHGSNLKNVTKQYAKRRAKYHHPNISWNMRDLGGYYTDNGKYEIKPHKIYRSSYIRIQKYRGAKQIQKYHIHIIIDLRNWSGLNANISHYPQPGEFGLRRDKYHLHLHYLNYPVETSHQDSVASHNARGHEIRRFNYWYTLSPTARSAYRNSLEAIYNNITHNNGVMYTCNSGRDRTGCLSIIIMSLLGAKRKDINYDFLLTNKYHYQNPYAHQLARVHRFRKIINRHYGSIYGYTRSKRGLNLSRQFITKFRHRLLKKVN